MWFFCDFVTPVYKTCSELLTILTYTLILYYQSDYNNATYLYDLVQFIISAGTVCIVHRYVPQGCRIVDCLPFIDLFQCIQGSPM